MHLVGSYLVHPYNHTVAEGEHEKKERNTALSPTRLDAQCERPLVYMFRFFLHIALNINRLKRQPAIIILRHTCVLR